MGGIKCVVEAASATIGKMHSLSNPPVLSKCQVMEERAAVEGKLVIAQFRSLSNHEMGFD